MEYKVGDILRCEKTINTQCLEMTNPCFDICIGDEYIVAYEESYKETGCHWYGIVFKDERVILNAWNDPGHMVLDDNFKVVGKLDSEAINNIHLKFEEGER